MTAAVLALLAGIGLVALSLPPVSPTAPSRIGDVRLGLRIVGAGLLMFGTYGLLWLLAR